MATPTTYTLRIHGRMPESFPMERLGDYIREFADLLGAENEPRLKAIKKASTGIVAAVAQSRRAHVSHRLRDARSRPESRAGRVLRRIETMLGEDHTKCAEILDAEGKLLFALKIVPPNDLNPPRARQAGWVDGIVTGMIGSDDTVHLHMRDDENRDVNLVVKDMQLARQILTHFRKGVVRVKVYGIWERTDLGWMPKQCVAESFESLEETSIREALDQMTAVPGNGWASMDDPMEAWNDLRGVH